MINNKPNYSGPRTWESYC